MSFLGRAVRPGRRGGTGPRAYYAGAAVNRTTADWYAQLLSADVEIKASLRTLRARSRQLYRDNPHASAFVTLLLTNVIGPNGIRLQSKVTTSNGDLRQATNGRIEAAWEEWGSPETCTVSGRLCWQEVEELALTMAMIDGEVLIRKRHDASNPHGFSLQFLDPDQLDEFYNVAPAAPGGPEIRMGVEITGDGRPLAYHLWTRHPSDPGARVRVPVPADEIIHRFVTQRPNQTRGVPRLAPILIRLNMLDGLEEAELIASRTGALNSVLFKVNEQGADVWADPEGTRAAPVVMDLEPGLGTQIPYGLDPVPFNPTHPTTAFAGFQKSILRSIAAGLGVSYVSLANDLEGVNYSSIRQGVLQERDEWRRLQRWLIRGLHRPVFRDWMVAAASTGALTLPTMDVARWMAPVWQARGWSWVDPVNDLQAAEREIRIGINSREALCGERGRDFEDTLDQLEREEAMAAARGLDVSGVDTIRQTQQAPAAESTPQPPNPTDAAPDDAEDDATARFRAPRFLVTEVLR